VDGGNRCRSAVARRGGSRWADEQKPYRVRGSLEAVQGNELTVKTRDGETLDATLKDASRVLVVRPANLEDIKRGDYVGLTSSRPAASGSP
jgi:hypothetical protein